MLIAAFLSPALSDMKLKVREQRPIDSEDKILLYKLVLELYS